MQRGAVADLVSLTTKSGVPAPCRNESWDYLQYRGPSLVMRLSMRWSIPSMAQQRASSYGAGGRKGPLPKSARAFVHQMLTQSRSSSVFPAGSATLRVALV